MGGVLQEEKRRDNVGDQHKNHEAGGDGAQDREYDVDKDDAEGVNEVYRGQIGKELG